MAMIGTARSDRGSDSTKARRISKSSRSWSQPRAGAGRDHGSHGGAAGEVDGDPGVLQRLDRADVAIGARAAARQHQTDRRAGDDAGDSLGVASQTFHAMEPAVGLKRVQPDAGVGRMAHSGIAQQDQIGQPATVAEAMAARHGRRRGQKRAADDEHPIHLAGAQIGPGGLILFGDIEDVVVIALDAVEPFGRRGQGRLVDDLTGEAHGLDGGADSFHEGADGAGAGRDEAEDAGLRRAGRSLARPADHQARQFDHQVRLGAGGFEKASRGRARISLSRRATTVAVWGVPASMAISPTGSPALTTPSICDG